MDFFFIIQRKNIGIVMLRKLLIILSIIIIGYLFYQFSTSGNRKITVLQFNIWQEGTMVDNGFSAIIDEIIRMNADLVALSEVRNYHQTNLARRMITALAKKGHIYYAQKSQDTGLISRYPIIKQTALFPVKNDQGSVTKAIIDINGQETVLYSAHLDYRHCSLYLPRGYDGSTWEELDTLVTDVEMIRADNLKSKRDEAIDAIIQDATIEKEKGRLIFIGGDFNEPSHLDWTVATKELYDHNGVVIQWRNTLALANQGFIDAYRECYPDPVTHPGFTFPADNPLVDITKLAWSPKADDRDRIDYIFYQPDSRLTLKEITIVGPDRSIVRNQRVPESSQDPFDVPPGIWPTDHKAIKATFEINY